MANALLREQGTRMRDVVVAELDDARAAELGAREQTAMAELVDQDQVGAADERRDHADVREVTAAEHDRVLSAFERGELALEIGVERMVAVHEPRGAGADA